jgi:hypothetical protein
LGYILGDFFTNSSGHPAADKKTVNAQFTCFYQSAHHWQPFFEEGKKTFAHRSYLQRPLKYIIKLLKGLFYERDVTAVDNFGI